MKSTEIRPGILLTWNPWALSINLNHGIRKTGETFLVLERCACPSPPRVQPVSYWKTLDSKGRIINRPESDIVEFMEVISEAG